MSGNTATRWPDVKRSVSKVVLNPGAVLTGILMDTYRSFWGRCFKILSKGMHGKWPQSSAFFWDFVTSSSPFKIESITVSVVSFFWIEAHLRFHFVPPIRGAWRFDQSEVWMKTNLNFLDFSWLYNYHSSAVLYGFSNWRYEISANQRASFNLKTSLRLRVTIWSNVPIYVIKKLVKLNRP